MVYTFTMSSYVQIKLPKNLIDEMDKLVGELGYTSRAEIAKDAIRRLLLALSMERSRAITVPLGASAVES